MFSKEIVRSDAFLDMPTSSQLLYFHLGMEADDDGFIDNSKTVMRVAGTNNDDLKILLTKRFLLSLKEGVQVIKHWKINNYIQVDRYHETKYIELKKGLTIKTNRAYTDRIQPVSTLDSQTRLDKTRKDYTIEKDISSASEEKEKTSKSVLPLYKELVSWAEDRRGFPFLRPLSKQYSAFKIARTNNLQPEQLRERWKEYEGKEKEFDWMTVVYSFNRKK